MTQANSSGAMRKGREGRNGTDARQQCAVPRQFGELHGLLEAIGLRSV